MPTTPKTPKSSKTAKAANPPAKSPLPATVDTPPKASLVTFYHWNPIGEKTLGLTPNGTRTVKLGLYSGKHHHFVKDKATGDIASGDRAPLSPYKQQFEAQKLHLYGQFANLKKRSDSDFQFFKKDGQIDPGHYEASVRCIKDNIAQLKKCCRLAPDPEAFISELNDCIKAGTMYNPFGLQQIYDASLGYQIALAKDPIVYQSPLEASRLLPKPAPATPVKRSAVKGGLFDGLPSPKFNKLSATNTKENDDPEEEEKEEEDCIFKFP